MKVTEFFYHRGLSCAWLGVRISRWDFLTLLRLDRVNKEDDDGRYFASDNDCRWTFGAIGWTVLCLPTEETRKTTQERTWQPTIYSK